MSSQMRQRASPRSGSPDICAGVSPDVSAGTLSAAPERPSPDVSAGTLSAAPERPSPGVSPRPSPGVSPRPSPGVFTDASAGVSPQRLPQHLRRRLARRLRRHLVSRAGKAIALRLRRRRPAFSAGPRPTPSHASPGAFPRVARHLVRPAFLSLRPTSHPPSPDRSQIMC